MYGWSKRDAARNWVESFDAIDTSMFEDYAIAYEGDVCEVTIDDEERYYDGLFPMWGTMWAFHEMLDNEWIDRGGLEIMSNLGFRIFESRKYGYFFGIEGAGFDFYEAFWIPLYDARGLKWHDEEEE